MPRTFVFHPTRGPTSTPKDLPPDQGDLRIEQVRSAIGHRGSMRATLASLGLRHHQDVVVHPDSPSLRGQLRRVRHLVSVTPVKEKGRG